MAKLERDERDPVSRIDINEQILDDAMDRIADLQRLVASLEQKLLYASSSADNTVLGSKERPVRGVYVADKDGGSVGFLDFKGSDATVRSTKVK